MKITVVEIGHSGADWRPIGAANAVYINGEYIPSLGGRNDKPRHTKKKLKKILSDRYGDGE